MEVNKTHFEKNGKGEGLMQIIRLNYKRWMLYLLGLLIVGINCQAPTPARDVLFSDQEPPEGFGAYGYLIFTKRPTNDNFDRYEAVCRAFLRNLEPVTEYPQSRWSSIMPTYWLAENRISQMKI